MSFLDSAKEKLQELADDNPDQVEQLSDQAISTAATPSTA